MDKWDKSENNKDELLDMIKNALPKFLEQQTKEPIQTFGFSAQLTKEQLKKVSEVLGK